MIKSNRGEKRVKLDDLRPKILTTKISFECKIFNILVLLGRTEDTYCMYFQIFRIREGTNKEATRKRGGDGESEIRIFIP